MTKINEYLKETETLFFLFGNIWRFKNAIHK